MMSYTEIKGTLISRSQDLINEKVTAIKASLARIKEGIENEMKSSMGDKFETTRAHLQQEQSNLHQQLSGINDMQDILHRVKAQLPTSQCELGSLVITDQLNYFLSAPLGKLNIDNTDFYAISPSSPIGQLLLGKSQNESYSFRQKTVKILEIH